MRYDYAYFFKTIFVESLIDTIFMVVISSILSVGIALILSIVFYMTNENSLRENKFIYSTISTITEYDVHITYNIKYANKEVVKVIKGISKEGTNEKKQLVC